LVVLQTAIEARYLLARCAFEAKASITLAVGYRRDHTTSRVIGAGAGIARSVATFLRVLGKAEGAYHVAIRLALLVDIADVFLAGRT
jgi:hypothetical protein